MSNAEVKYSYTDEAKCYVIFLFLSTCYFPKDTTTNDARHSADQKWVIVVFSSLRTGGVTRAGLNRAFVRLFSATE